MIHRLVDLIRFPPPYEGPILSGRVDGLAYLVGWLATFAHLLMWVFVLALGLDSPWPTISTVASAVGTLLLITIVIVIHRRLGRAASACRSTSCGNGGSVRGTPSAALSGSRCGFRKRSTRSSEARRQ